MASRVFVIIIWKLQFTRHIYIFWHRLHSVTVTRLKAPSEGFPIVMASSPLLKYDDVTMGSTSEWRLLVVAGRWWQQWQSVPGAVQLQFTQRKGHDSCSADEGILYVMELRRRNTCLCLPSLQLATEETSTQIWSQSVTLAKHNGLCFRWFTLCGAHTR